jgi:hypothetical protein
MYIFKGAADREPLLFGLAGKGTVSEFDIARQIVIAIIIAIMHFCN